jgi:vancomycin resistance protein YoaR
MAKIFQTDKQKVKRQKFLTSVTLYSFILFFMVIGSEISIRAYFDNRISNNVSFKGISVSGMSREEFNQLIGNLSTDYTEIEISVGSEKYRLNLGDIKYSLDADKNWQLSYSSKKTYLKNPYLLSFPLSLRSVSVKPIVSYDKELLSEEVDKILSLSSIKPVFEKVVLVGGTIQLIGGKDGYLVDKDDAIKTVINALSEQIGSVTFELHPVSSAFDDIKRESILKEADGLVGKTILINFEEDSYKLSDSKLISTLNDRAENDYTNISEIVTEASDKFNRDPKEPIFVFENGKVTEFSPSIYGVFVDQGVLSTQIINQRKILSESEDINITIDLPFIKTLPKTQTENINNLGIKEKIGSGISYFKGSILSRIHNIKLASSKFNGVLISPGETFSFNKTLGDVSKVTGYQPAYIIKDGQTILGDGGGVCQVSTTLFRAALNTGLPIIERRSHSYRVSYYEQSFPPGLDATVFDPTTDLKIKNDTGNHILIQTIFNEDNKMLTFNLYGTSDGRTVTLTKPVITGSTPPPEDLYIDDPSLKSGVVKQIDYKAWGAKVYFSYKVERDGSNTFEKIFYSNYQPWQAKFLRGTGL